MISSNFEARIVELVFAPWETLPGEFQKLGLKCELEENGETLLIRNETFGAGLTRSTDPINRAVLLAMVLCGSAWTHFFPELLEKVDVEWKLQRSLKNKI